MTTANLSVADNETVIQYLATPGQTEFVYDFPILASSELKVTVDQVVNHETTNYTVAGVGDDAGGTVTFNVAMTGGERVTLYLELAFERLTGFATGAAVLLPEALNSELAQVTRLSQILRRDIHRSLRIPIDDPQDSQDLELPIASARKGKFLYFSATDGTPEMAEGIDASQVLSRSVIGGFLNPETAGETASGDLPTDKGFPEWDVRRFGAVQDGTDQTDIVNAAIRAMVGADTLGVSGGTIFVPMGVGVTLTDLVLKRNVTVVIDNGQTRTTLMTGHNVSGAVNEFWLRSQLHPAFIVDAHDDLDGPALGGGQVLSYRCSYLWAQNGTTKWQFSMDIDAVKADDLCLYADSPSRQLQYWDHGGSIRYGRRASLQDFSVPLYPHTFCGNAAVVKDSGSVATFALAQITSGVSEQAGAFVHRKTFELETDGELTLVNDAGTGFPWRVTDEGAMRTTQGISGGNFTTAQRNAFAGLTANHRGLMVFDTTLVKPVWLNSVGPLVWKDATGATV